ncbi:PAS domain S-box protein [Burkholderia contaminans]|jgi:two-component system NarL family sensor kinase|uniref:sensor histidine kinase n=1 Tax=Burkholderia TaxID=32008 RepID=UPI000D004897|nr:MULTISPECIES: PAS domain-containing sensor histidine kinase [Burkholderia]MBH9669861.1 PAS domain S-box protein [Burkholderia contaminans]MBH9677121.1 PAS domain S-box protein [Burkholderia contaminans]MBH9707545.1 PAS domain S-box protein [Burkholderia contaminans]MBH9723443.1 PAS domain S-box protein [Burkholderia contaminans]MBM6428183.1 PAS domain S-box protein [Burkholderia contaminans]
MTERQPEGPRIRLLDLIDAMRKLRGALRHDDSRRAVVTDARGAALAILADDGAFVSVNRSTAALFGYKSAELVGRQLRDLAPDDAHVALADELSASAALEHHSFTAMLGGRSGHPAQFVIHRQALPGTRMWLTLFEESPMPEPARRGDAANDAGVHACHTYLLMGQQKERHRLAAELHDGLGQALTLIKLMNEDALMRLRRGEIADATILLDVAVLRIRETIGEVRQICGELKPPMLDRLGLPAALASLCRRIERDASQLSVEFNCDVDDNEIPEHLKADMFRVAQEALHNVVKHAQATEITLGLQHDAGGLLLTIDDNGVGYERHPLATDDARTAGLGLIGMQHRIESHGGTFGIQSSATTGTRVSATWPL